MWLPWEYGVRNLARRPMRTGLTLAALSTVVMLILIVVGFIRGLENSLAISGDPNVVLVYSVNSEQNIENSAIDAVTSSLLPASLQNTWIRYGIPHVSPELFLGSRVQTAAGSTGLGLVRGVTRIAPLVRRKVRLIQGTWPQDGQIIVGKLAAAKLGFVEGELRVGQVLQFEGRQWQISGEFEADGSAFESELWCDLAQLQTATKRQDLSLVALLLNSPAAVPEVSLFCQERLDLELKAIRETEYYASLQHHYKPVRQLAWMVVTLVSTAGIFAGLNLMYGAVAGRVRGIATLQAIGYRRRAILVSLMQEGTLLAAAASLLSGTFAILWVDGLAIRFTMGAFALRIDGFTIAVACGVGLLLGALGAIPPALKVLRQSVVISLKSN